MKKDVILRQWVGNMKEKQSKDQARLQSEQRRHFLFDNGFVFDNVNYTFINKELDIEVTTELVEHFIYDIEVFKELIKEQIEYAESIQ